MIEVLSGNENMQRDYANLLKAEGGGGPISRLYAWEELTISIGYFQKGREFPVSVVRRPTGGGALLHGWDLSFSVADLRERWGKGYKGIYLNLMKLLKESLEKLGVSLELSNYTGSYDQYFCFYYPTFGEITYKGKKLVACAMRVLKSSFLLHGSLFLSFDYKTAQSITSIPERALKDRIVSIEELGVGREEVLNAINDFLTSVGVRKNLYVS